MLLEEQAAELLSRCERIVGIELRQTRGNLRKASSRAAAVWELLVIEAASALGFVEYEPHPGASPDLALRVNGGRRIWIEAAYLYPRFWDEERRSLHVAMWIQSEAKKYSLSDQNIRIRLDGRHSAAGFKRILPKFHEKKDFVQNPELRKFFREVSLARGKERFCTLSGYSISLAYSPNPSPYWGGVGGLVQESATVVSENAVYRAIKAKAKQHSVTGPRVICIGSDQSLSLSSIDAIRTGRPTGTQAAHSALRKHPSISCAIVVAIEPPPGSVQPKARGDFFGNPNAVERLTEKEREALLSLDFNRWSYTYPLLKWETDEPEDQFRRATGKLQWSKNRTNMKIKIPCDVVVDALGGKRSVAEAYGIATEELRALKEGWRIVSCTLEPGNIEAAEAPRLLIELSPPHLDVFWSRRKRRGTRE